MREGRYACTYVFVYVYDENFWVLVPEECLEICVIHTLYMSSAVAGLLYY